MGGWWGVLCELKHQLAPDALLWVVKLMAICIND